MGAIQALMYANIAIWLGIGGYFFLIAKKQNDMDRRLKNLMSQMDIEK